MKKEIEYYPYHDKKANCLVMNNPENYGFVHSGIAQEVEKVIKAMELNIFKVKRINPREKFFVVSGSRIKIYFHGAAKKDSLYEVERYGKEFLLSKASYDGIKYENILVPRVKK